MSNLKTPEQLDRVRRLLAVFPQNQQPKVYLIGSDCGIINNAVKLYYAQHDLSVEVVSETTFDEIKKQTKLLKV